jgi:protoheme IX farnesyltransferase
MKQKLKDYYEISKPGILTLVVMTTALGFFLADKSFSRWELFLITLFGSTLCAAGAGALNHYLEKDIDILMDRTKNRPLPAHRLTPIEVLIFGVTTSIVGSSILAWQVNHLCGFLSLMTTFLYALVYTPLKRITWLNTAVGAIPGALPAMGGWAAATGNLSIEAWILFLIMFIWQHPHFYAIAWILREDYKKGGFKMLPVLDENGIRTFSQIKIYSIALLFSSVLLTFIGTTGIIYGVGAIVLGSIMIWFSEQSSESKSNKDARRLFLYSIIYLPALFILIAADVSLSVLLGI